MHKFISRALLVIGLISVTSAEATLIGDTITVGIQGAAPVDVVVGAGVEIDGLGILTAGETFDITGNSIVGSFRNGFFAGDVFSFSGLDWVGARGEIIGLELLSNTFPVTLAEFSFTTNSVTWTTAATPGGTVGSWELGIITTHVPEPTSLTLLGLGLAGIGYSRKRK